MKKWVGLSLIVAVICIAVMAHAAYLVSTDGTPNSSGVYTVQVDTDRAVTIASDASLVMSGTATNTGTFTNSGKFVVNTEVAVTSDTLTAAESGITIINAYTLNGATYTLPTAAAGLEFSFVSSSDKTFNVDTGLTTDSIRYLSLDAGDKITSTAVTGDAVTVISGATGYWDIKSMNKTWTDGGS